MTEYMNMGFFLYYQISSVSSIGFLPNLVPKRVNEIFQKNPIQNDNLHIRPKSEKASQPLYFQHTDDLANQLVQNSQILKAEYQRVQNQLNDLKSNLLRVTEELYSAKLLLENSRSCCDKSEYLKYIKDLFDKALNELHRNETEFKENITRALNEFRDKKVKGIIDEFDKSDLNSNQKNASALSCLSISNASFEYVNEVIRKYDADKTAVIDYALKAHGARVLDIRCTTPYYMQKQLFNFYSWLHFPDPETILNYRIEPGKCFVFVGFPGIFVIELAQSITVTEFGLEHIPQDILLKQNSTPKHFTVLGLNNVNDLVGHEFGTYIYDIKGSGLQLFPVQNQKDTQFKIVQLIVNSNYGSEDYTCLYRFRVHGF